MDARRCNGVTSHEQPGMSNCKNIFFFFNDTATTEIYTLYLHDALPICTARSSSAGASSSQGVGSPGGGAPRSEEHTSELQSRLHLVCRLLLEKKKKQPYALPHRLLPSRSPTLTLLLYRTPPELLTNRQR